MMFRVCPHINFGIMFLLYVQHQKVKSRLVVGYSSLAENMETLCNDTKVSVRV